jgi:GTP-binding protein
MLPTVAIVGRPNVGKSSLFNRLIGRPIAIVDPTAGVTRDRLLHPVRRDDMEFDLIDTGGIGIVDEAKLEADVHLQIDRAIEHADHLLFVVDGIDGITPLDREIAARLRPEVHRLTLVVNKIDELHQDEDIHEFLQLGVGDPHPVSTIHKRGLFDLFDLLAETLPEAAPGTISAAEYDGRLKICLAGRRNVGKSSLTNTLLGEERVIVADHAGTTRDAIDSTLDCDEGQFVLIDTAGLRKKRQLRQDLEYYAACRTERAVGRADVVLLVLDSSDEIGEVDKKLAHFCEASGKPVIIVLNKWDIAREMGGADLETYTKWLKNRLPGLAWAPVVTVSAVTGERVHSLLAMANEVHAEAAERVATPELNTLIQSAVSRRRPRKIGPTPTKLYYATQADIRPPTFVIFVNRTDWIEPGYRRYLENYLRERLPFARVPLRVVFKARTSAFHEGQDQHERILGRTRAERRGDLILPGGRAKRTRGGGGGRGGGAGGRGGAPRGKPPHGKGGGGARGPKHGGRGGRR